MDTSTAEKILNQEGIFENVIKVSSVSGGDINEAYCLETSYQKLFVKLNDKTRYPDMFEKEKQGLEMLGKTQKVKVPEVLGVGEVEQQSYLLMSWIEETKKDEAFWMSFGQQLARMHQQGDVLFGLDHDNYIGSLAQRNTEETEWSSFFWNHRLEPWMALLFNEGRLKSEDLKKFELLAGALEKWVPHEKSALVHGDLWSGNFMAVAEGPCLIDPAVYHGHREMDIAMMHLFGGFDSMLFQSYNEVFPMEKGWRERLDLHNLYPLLVHAVLFGDSYLVPIRKTLNRFV